MRSSNSLIQKAKDFIELSNKLIQKDYKKKDIASEIELPASVFSSLYKTVLPKVVEIDIISSSKDVEIKIDNAFSLVNNLSKSKIVSNIDKYNNKLKNLTSTSKSNSLQFDYFMNLKRHAESNFEYIRKYYKGLYYLYYISTDNYAIKRDAFMIKPNLVNNTNECYKGNNNSKVRYYGIVTMVGTHILNFHMSEKNISPHEYLLMNLSLPSIRNIEFSRGIFANLTYSRQPIGKKFVLTKISNEADENIFQKMDILTYNESELSQIQEISNYLLAPDAKTECRLVTSPSFNLADLEKELKISMNIK